MDPRILFDHPYPFAIYRLPGEELGFKLILQDDERAHPLDLSTPGFAIAPFDESAAKGLMIKGEAQSLELPESATRIRSIAHNSPDPTYIHMIEKGIEKIRSGGLQKIVLSRIASHSYEDVDYRFVLSRLANNHPSAFVFYYYHPLCGAWFGASPEVLLQKSNETFSTMALAGTKSQTDQRDWSEKEIDEQAIVTMYIREELRSKGIEDLLESDTFTSSAGHIQHLQTNFNFEAQISPTEILKALHPTPATCGLPKNEALAYINNLETHPRDYYCGYLGPVQNNGDFDLFVNLRSARRIDSKIEIFVGGGITADSVPSAEWFETELKSRTLLSVL
ncbi:MAG: chorismate-binding protein [Flavobacteriales bacterium]|nr:chorismate-binding protein [Flavobacteriales bacterium]